MIVAPDCSQFAGRFDHRAWHDAKDSVDSSGIQTRDILHSNKLSYLLSLTFALLIISESVQQEEYNTTQCIPIHTLLFGDPEAAYIGDTEAGIMGDLCNGSSTE